MYRRVGRTRLEQLVFGIGVGSVEVLDDGKRIGDDDGGTGGRVNDERDGVSGGAVGKDARGFGSGREGVGFDIGEVCPGSREGEFFIVQGIPMSCDRRDQAKHG